MTIERSSVAEEKGLLSITQSFDAFLEAILTREMW